MWGWVSNLIKPVLAPVASAVEGWQKRKTVKLESELAIARAKTDATIERIKTTTEGDIAWENTSIGNSGWKDEYLTIVLSAPLIMCFVPGLVPYVKAGFAALAECPDWYKWSIGIMVSSAFGYKKLANFMALKKGA